MKRFMPLLTGAALLLAVAMTSLAAPKIEEKIVGPAFTPGVVYTLSPKGMHVATAHGRDGKTLVTVDGVEGPLMDNIFFGAAYHVVVKISEDGYYNRVEYPWTGPVAFSPNGERHAYAGQVGKDVVVFLDGKEIFREPFSQKSASVSLMQFSPDSKHVFFHNQTTNSYQSYRLMMDGQPVTPVFEGKQMPVFSADGSRWAFAASPPKLGMVKFLVVDGKKMDYPGEKPQFTPDGKHVVCVAGQMRKWSLLVDGKEMVSGSGFRKFVISPTGDIGAIMSPNSEDRVKLFLNGKPVVDDAADVVFSPDGKRWAALCGLNQKTWVITSEGQRHKEYGPIMNVTFTPDSSKLVYVASIGDTTYVVTDGKEDKGNKLVHYRPVFAQTGNAFFYIAGFMMKKLSVHYNDHVEPECLDNNNVTLSPDGKRWVYYSKRADNTTRFIENGKETGPSAMVQGGAVLFSPDSKHMVAPLFQAYWCDGQRIVPTATPVGFTPDSQHLILKGKASTPEGAQLITFFVNGDLVAKFSARGSTWANYGSQKGAWEQQPDGTIVFVGWDIGMAVGHGPIKRITVTPDPARNYVAWLASLKTN
jgi:WD40 repeat protein